MLKNRCAGLLSLLLYWELEMPTGTYTIDATNNAEPLDSRYVADFPAELRAMKTRMNEIGRAHV